MLNNRIAEFEKEIARHAREDETARRVMTLKFISAGIDRIAATAVSALAPPPGAFAKGHDPILKRGPPWVVLQERRRGAAKGF